MPNLYVISSCSNNENTANHFVIRTRKRADFNFGAVFVVMCEAMSQSDKPLRTKICSPPESFCSLFTSPATNEHDATFRVIEITEYNSRLKFSLAKMVVFISPFFVLTRCFLTLVPPFGHARHNNTERNSFYGQLNFQTFYCSNFQITKAI